MMNVDHQIQVRALIRSASMVLQFRPAKPEDAAIAVPLIYSSGPAAFDFVFADDRHRSGEDFLHYAFHRRGGEFGYTNHTVVTRNGQVVGVGACFSSKSSVAFMITVVFQMLRFYRMTRGLSAISRGLKIEKLFKLPPFPKNYFAHLGVSPECQGQGIGRRLVEHFLERSRTEHQTHAALDVSITNIRAQALYERIGFKTIEERASSMPGVCNHLRMEMPI
jgi:ribosomal protein S18 acetylase RimI-like enzyme